MDQRFWHEIEGRPWAEVQAIQEAALRRQLAYLEAASAFYRDKLRAAGVRFDAVKTAADLARVPLTLKTELRESLAAGSLGFSSSNAGTHSTSLPTA